MNVSNVLILQLDNFYQRLNLWSTVFVTLTLGFICYLKKNKCHVFKGNNLILEQISAFEAMVYFTAQQACAGCVTLMKCFKKTILNPCLLKATT